MKKFKITSLLFFVFLFLALPFFASQAEGIIDNLRGKIVLKVEDAGQAYYIDRETDDMYYLGRPEGAFLVMRELGVGISNQDLERIPIGIRASSGEDSDGDGLSDIFEDAIGTNKNLRDTDLDGHEDKIELSGGFSPFLFFEKMGYDEDFAKKNAGRIFLQVENKGEAWYVNPADYKRYFLGRPADAFEVMRGLGLGVSNANFSSLETGLVKHYTEREKASDAISKVNTIEGACPTCGQEANEQGHDDIESGEVEEWGAVDDIGQKKSDDEISEKNTQELLSDWDDSDNDGLIRYEEVFIYKTDVNNSDSDGDGVSDGDEVMAWTDPKGEGSLGDRFSSPFSTLIYVEEEAIENLDRELYKEHTYYSDELIDLLENDFRISLDDFLERHEEVIANIRTEKEEVDMVHITAYQELEPGLFKIDYTIDYANPGYHPYTDSTSFLVELDGKWKFDIYKEFMHYKEFEPYTYQLLKGQYSNAVNSVSGI